MSKNNILKLEVNNKTKHLEKYLRSQWTWKTYAFIVSLISALIFVIIDLEINFIKLSYPTSLIFLESDRRYQKDLYIFYFYFYLNLFYYNFQKLIFHFQNL